MFSINWLFPIMILTWDQCGYFHQKMWKDQLSQNMFFWDWLWSDTHEHLKLQNTIYPQQIFIEAEYNVLEEEIRRDRWCFISQQRMKNSSESRIPISWPFDPDAEHGCYCCVLLRRVHYSDTDYWHLKHSRAQGSVSEIRQKEKKQARESIS